MTDAKTTLVRIQKHIADLGICSRRKAEILIAEGKVSLNGKIIKTMGVKVDPHIDVVRVETNESAKTSDRKSGSRSKNERPKIVYIALHKPIDFITSTSDKQGRTILGLLTSNNCVSKNQDKIARRKAMDTRVYPVGRLDKDSEGLVLLTNDGELTNVLTHPKFEHGKEYEVTIDEPLSRDAKKVLERGMLIDDETVSGLKIKKELRKGRQFVVTVILKEGKNRQIRKMFGNLGYNLISLKRTRIAKLTLGTLPVGKWRFVRKDQIV